MFQTDHGRWRIWLLQPRRHPHFWNQSIQDAVMMMMDIKKYYIGIPLTRFEYMIMLLSRFPEEIVQKYNLNALALYGWVYIEILKGMFGLKQSGLLANQ
jgi:hypothetical protein